MLSVVPERRRPDRNPYPLDDDQNTTEVMNFYYHMSLLWTVTHVTDENENVVESYEYTPYGETTIKDINASTISTSAIYNPYRYTARRQDDSTGLYHYRRRAYDPERGRFLQRDPLGYVDGLNIHEYTSSRPVITSDPLGECGFPDCPLGGSEEMTAEELQEMADAEVSAAGAELDVAQGEVDQWVADCQAAGFCPDCDTPNGLLQRILVLKLQNLLQRKNDARARLQRALAHRDRTLDWLAEVRGIETDWDTQILIGGGVVGLGKQYGRRLVARLGHISPGAIAGNLGPKTVALSLEKLLTNPQLLAGKSPFQILAALGRIPKNWIIGTLGRGAHKGRGLVLREMDEAGNLTGRLIRWHPGGGHHGAAPYWRVSDGANKSGVIR